MSRIPLFIAMAVLVFGPGSARAETAEEPKKTDDFGAALTLEGATPLADVLTNAKSYADRPVQIHGRLTDVCQRKGCWTVIQDGDVQVRVTFKDYGFFVPKDATGREARVEGVVTIETLTEKQARHYESESRDGNPDAVKGPQRQFGFVATGVRLVRK